MTHFSALDFSPLQLAPHPFRVAKLKKKLNIATQRLMFFDNSNRFNVGSLSDIELSYVARIFEFCLVNNLPFAANLSGKFPEPQSRLTGRWNLELHMITYALIVQSTDAYWTEIGEYRVGENSKSKDTARYASYARVKLASPLPPMVINSKVVGNQYINPGQLTRYETESSEFNELFDLYVDHSRMSESLSVLAPNIIAELIDFYRDCDLELADGRLFIMGPQVNIAATGALHDFIIHTEHLTKILTHKVALMSEPFLNKQMQSNTMHSPKKHDPYGATIKKDFLIAFCIVSAVISIVVLLLTMTT